MTYVSQSGWCNKFSGGANPVDFCHLVVFEIFIYQNKNLAMKKDITLYGINNLYTDSAQYEQHVQ